ncbi:MAG: thiamine-phosphate kinase [Thermodesulfobacteriota bacterium]|nr:thiamine-phosphate kinase [Thermodesulfobacteriota bacterium]
MEDKDLKMEDIGEFGFIRSIRNGCHFCHKKLIKGIGDDCAVIGPYEDKVLLITTDMLIEDIHFVLGKVPPEQIGGKAVAVNMSDIAAMGGRALHLFVSLAVPRGTNAATIHAIYRGIKEACRSYGVNILGGDTSASPDKLMINMTVIGDAPQEEVLYRSGAALDDGVYVTGTLGDSAAGLKLINKDVSAPKHIASPLIEAHTRPVPFLKAGRMIARSRLASAMIDLSDGLVADLWHVCEAGDLGASLIHEALPISDELKALAEENSFDPYNLAVSGGEDYRLLITVPRKNADLFQRMFEKAVPCPIYCVGKIIEEKRIEIVRPDGTKEQLEAAGFDHFIPAQPAL